MSATFVIWRYGLVGGNPTSLTLNITTELKRGPRERETSGNRQFKILTQQTDGQTDGSNLEVA